MAVRVVPTAFVEDLPPLHWIFPAYAKKAGLRGRRNSASEAAISSRCRTALFELLRAAARDGLPGDAGEGIALRRKVDARVVAGDAAPPIFLLYPWRFCRSRASARSGGVSEKNDGSAQHEPAPRGAVSAGPGGGGPHRGSAQRPERQRPARAARVGRSPPANERSAGDVRHDRSVGRRRPVLVAH